MAKKRMTQTETVDYLSKKLEMNKQEVKDFLNALSELAMKEVKKNDEFTVPGFGKLVKVRRKARDGRNPATGKPMRIPAKTTAKFRVSKRITDSVA